MTTINDEHRLIAEGVDEEPVEANRRMYTGRTAAVVIWIAIAYSAFHMLALNGVSISGMTGGLIEIPLLPQFPIETWNFRIAHVAGALFLGFVLFAARPFSSDSNNSNSVLVRYLAFPLLACALFSLGVAFYFGWQIANGVAWQGLDATIRFNEIWKHRLDFFFGMGNKRHKANLGWRAANDTPLKTISGLRSHSAQRKLPHPSDRPSHLHQINAR